MLNFPLALTLRLGARYNCRFLLWAGLSDASQVHNTAAETRQKHNWVLSMSRRGLAHYTAYGTTLLLNPFLTAQRRNGLKVGSIKHM